MVASGPKFAKMTIPQLREYARDHGINLRGERLKAKLVATIRRARRRASAKGGGRGLYEHPYDAVWKDAIVFYTNHGITVSKVGNASDGKDVLEILRDVYEKLEKTHNEEVHVEQKNIDTLREMGQTFNLHETDTFDPAVFRREFDNIQEGPVKQAVMIIEILSMPPDSASDDEYNSDYY